jgi:exodeoxyribonuclease VII large subunit
MEKETRNIYSVSRLNTEVRQVLEGSFPLAWVEGEISNLSTPRSGHMYFSLKDEHAQTRCAMFRMKRQLLRFMPADGMKVLIRARITLYEARGDFQLVVEHMEPAGEGQLRQAIERLKNQLEKEGLFDTAHKKNIPAMPGSVGIVTSATGAAIRDVLHVFNRRFPAIDINVYPVPVQGENAAAEICAMLKLVDKRRENDLVILTRGGGSLEDLMPFNDEQLARTLFAMQTPVISAVGHETDTSISDYVADRRAPTPSAAAELASPDQQQVSNSIENLLQRLKLQQRQKLQQLKAGHGQLRQRLEAVSPERLLQARSQSVDLLEQRLHQLHERKINQATIRLSRLETRLLQLSPVNQVDQLKIRFHGIQKRLVQLNPDRQLRFHQQKLLQLDQQIKRVIQQVMDRKSKQLASAARMLESVSPLATLGRGYSITRDDSGRVIREASKVQKGQLIETLLANGSITSRIE